MNFIDLIARANYLEVLQSGKSSELETYLNNIRRLKGLFISLGATEDIINTPAYFEKIREVFDKNSRDFSDCYRAGEDVGYRFQYTENGIKMSTETRHAEEKWSYLFDETGFTYIKTANIGEIERRIKVSTQQRLIADKKITGRRFGDQKTQYNTIHLDENGLPVKQTIVTIDAKATQYMQDFTRDGLNIQSTRNGKQQLLHKWLGNPISLQKEKPSLQLVISNLQKILQINENLYTYLETLYGKEIMKCVQQSLGQNYGD